MDPLLIPATAHGSSYLSPLSTTLSPLEKEEKATRRARLPGGGMTSTASVLGGGQCWVQTGNIREHSP